MCYYKEITLSWRVLRALYSIYFLLSLHSCARQIIYLVLLNSKFVLLFDLAPRKISVPTKIYGNNKLPQTVSASLYVRTRKENVSNNYFMEQRLAWLMDITAITVQIPAVITARIKSTRYGDGCRVYFTQICSVSNCLVPRTIPSVPSNYKRLLLYRDLT